MIRNLLAPFLSAVFCFSQCEATSLDFVHVGNPGNAGDVQPNGTFGAVAYEYAIGRTEVTNGQYTEFLNAVAANDPHSLFNSSMASDPRGGITQSGSSGSYAYSTKPNMADKPVNFVSFFDAMRFANWLHNGQGSAGTESGAYTIGNGLNEIRSTGARYWIPSEDEWYKAAYYQPASEGGDTDGYWTYATATNATPTVATASSVGDISNPGTNVANYLNGADWNSVTGNLTTVASAGTGSASFYGTFDQSGNVNEWTEAVKATSFRGWRGGSYNFSANGLQAYNPNFSFYRNFPFSERADTGFRIATPEPSSGLLLLIGYAVSGTRKRR